MTPEIGMRPGADLAGQVAIVTGGAKNIGRAIARSLAAGGAAVMVNAVNSLAEAAQTAELIRAADGRAEVFAADVRDYAAVEAMVSATVSRFGRLSLLVNNHTYRHTTPVEELSLAEWQTMIGVVLTGVFHTIRAAVPELRAAGGGSIVNIGGMSTHVGYRGGAGRSAAKAGVEGLTRAAALDLACYGITVNCVAPGAIDTVRDARTRHGTMADGGTGGALTHGPGGEDIPAGRKGQPEEIAAMVRMLCGPEARYITGQTIHVNGGALRP
jgi:3-oxoacyl-[acyl-carrier protein] reductase